MIISEEVMGDHAIVPPVPDIGAIENQILGLANDNILSLRFKVARYALLRAHEELDYLHYHCKSMVEIGTLPPCPDYLAHRVKSALRSGREGLRLIWNVHATITRAPGIAQYIRDARTALLQFMRHHGAAALPDHLARFELDTPPKKRLPPRRSPRLRYTRQ